MQVNSSFFPNMEVIKTKSGNSLPSTNSQDSRPVQKNPSMRELARNIDPSNMNRNEARAIATALGRSGELTIDNAFALQSMVLVNENGNMRSATATDSIMNEKFNMFEALESSIEFHKSKGLSTSHLEDALQFLEKFQTYRENPEINLHT